MRSGGVVLMARMALASLLRASAALPVWIGTALSVGADLVDPEMPETITQPREWLPRLWARTGGRSPAEPKD